MKLTESRILYALVFIASLTAYLLTLCPTVYSGDSGDFITASYTLGVAHPTGYPLYMILGKAFSLLPIGSVAYRYNLMSALFASLTAVLVLAIIRSLTKSWLAGIGGSLTLAYSSAIWGQATIAEAYVLNGFFTAFLLYLALRFRQKREAKKLAYFLFAYGLALTNHVSSILYVPAFAYLIAYGNMNALRRINPLTLIGYFAAPLILYLYIPLRALGNPIYNWGNPSNLSGFIRHITGFVHRQTYVMTLTKEQVFERFFGLVFHLARQFSLTGLLVLSGLYRHGGRNTPLLHFTGLIAVADFIYGLFLNDVSLDITTFSIPTIIALSVWSGFGYKDVLKHIRVSGLGGRSREAFVAVAVLVVFISHYHMNDRSQNLIAYDYAMNILRTVEEDAVLFAEGDNTVLPLYYLHLVEQVKPEVTIYERSGLLSHSLYGEDFILLNPAEHLERQIRVEKEVISRNKPVYYTNKVEYEIPGYDTVQTGIIYKVMPEGQTPPDLDYFRLYDMRQVWNTSIHLDYMTKTIKAGYYTKLAEYYLRSDPEAALSLLRQASEILPENKKLGYDIGNILLSKGEYDQASKEFRAVIEENPDDEKAHNNLGYTYALMGAKEAARRQYIKALKLNPIYVTARYNLASLLMQEGRGYEAAEQFKLITEMEPGYAKAYLNLGAIYYNRGEYNSTVTAWSRYLELDPHGENAPEVKARLEKILAES